MYKMILFFILLIGVLLLVTYLCERFHIGKSPATSAPAPMNTPTLEQNYLYDYITFGTDVMLSCISDNYLECGLSHPGMLPKHMAPDGEKVKIDTQHGLVYQYDFSRSFLIAGGGLRKNAKKHYSTLQLQNIINQLNDSFTAYSISAGFGATKIVGQQELENGKIRLMIGGVPYVTK